MTAIDDLFVEIEHHKIMMAHASLVLAAKSEYKRLLADNIGNRKAWDDCYKVNCELRALLAAKLEYGQLLTENDNLRRIISEMEMQDLQTEEEYKQEMFDRNQLDRIIAEGKDA